MQTIDIQPNVPAQKFTTTLNGLEFEFALQWNTRSEFWTMSLKDSDGETLINGIAMKSGVDLLEPYILDIGHLCIVFVSGVSTEMTLDNAGIDTVLVYLEQGEEIE